MQVRVLEQRLARVLEQGLVQARVQVRVQVQVPDWGLQALRARGLLELLELLELQLIQGRPI